MALKYLHFKVPGGLNVSGIPTSGHCDNRKHAPTLPNTWETAHPQGDTDKPHDTLQMHMSKSGSVSDLVYNFLECISPDESAETLILS